MSLIGDIIESVRDGMEEYPRVVTNILKSMRKH